MIETNIQNFIFSCLTYSKQDEHKGKSIPVKWLLPMRLQKQSIYKSSKNVIIEQSFTWNDASAPREVNKELRLLLYFLINPIKWQIQKKLTCILKFIKIQITQTSLTTWNPSSRRSVINGRSIHLCYSEVITDKQYLLRKDYDYENSIFQCIQNIDYFRNYGSR